VPFPIAILLDLDDTLLDFEGPAERCWRLVCEQHAAEIDNLAAERLVQAILEQRRWFWSDPERQYQGRMNLERTREEIVHTALLRLGINEPTRASHISQAYTISRNEAVTLFPDTLDTLNRLRRLGVRMALITNGLGVDQRSKIDRFALACYFDFILVESEFGVGKPDERVYLHVLEHLKISPTDAWMVGDYLECDVAAPQKMSIRGIWMDVRRAGLSKESTVRPDRIVHIPGELLLENNGK
jgi:putative hydrolase of the HAD superfamily